MAELADFIVDVIDFLDNADYEFWRAVIYYCCPIIDELGVDSEFVVNYANWGKGIRREITPVLQVIVYELLDPGLVDVTDMFEDEE